ncbi:MAG: PP2C family protein-serine/threonine phosphatase [Polyangiales bacterium]
METAQIAADVVSDPFPSAAPPSPPTSAPIVADSYGVSIAGSTRMSNEDQFVVATLARALFVQQSSVRQSAYQYADSYGRLLVVAEGMGGQRGSHEASTLAVNAIEHFLLRTLRWVFDLDSAAPDDDDRVVEELQGALRHADSRVFEEAIVHPELRGMGAAVTLAYSRGPDLYVAHAGDSRCYLLRSRTLHLLTRDHTLEQEMIDYGIVEPQNVDRHLLRHIVTNAIGGGSPGVDVEVHKVRLEPGDILLLCTDGLSSVVSDEEIAQTFELWESPRAACDRLVACARERDGKDSVTAIVTRYDLDTSATAH